MAASPREPAGHSSSAGKQPAAARFTALFAWTRHTETQLREGRRLGPRGRASGGGFALLQLVDDLQDLRPDRREGALTIFTQAAGRVPLDELTTRTLSFGQRVMRRMDQMPARSQALKEMIQKSYTSLLIWSAGECGELYTRDYLAELETHSPFRFASVAARRKQLAKWTGPLTRLFEAFLQDDQDPAVFPLPATALLSAS